MGLPPWDAVVFPYPHLRINDGGNASQYPCVWIGTKSWTKEPADATLPGSACASVATTMRCLTPSEKLVATGHRVLQDHAEEYQSVAQGHAQGNKWAVSVLALPN